MTEAEWLASDDPVAMLSYLCGPIMRSRDDPMADNPEDRFRILHRESHPSFTGRKLRLFACACCRTWKEEGAAEALIDKWEETGHPLCTRAARWAENWCVSVDAPVKAIKAALLRDIFGNPFRPAPVLHVKVGGNMYIPPPAPNPFDWQLLLGLYPVLAWNSGTVPRLARTIYDERRFEDMPVLADALEEAGCDNEDILQHCRGYYTDRAGNWVGELRHVRGCWVLDLLLGNE